MKLKYFLNLFTIFVSSTLIGQSLNEYKYVVIPAKYDFQKSADQYQLNSLSKFLFEKEGFITQFDKVELSADMANNPCEVLTVNIDNTSNMFNTRMIIELINCKNQKVLISEEGRSKEKDYKKGYQEALRNAFKSVTEQDYNYTGKSTTTSVKNATQKVENATDDVEEVEVEEVEVVEVVEISENEKPEEIEITEEVEEIEETMIDSSADIVSTKKYDNRDRDDKGNILSVPTEKLLYAQKNRLGYQLVDSSPKIVFILLNSSKKEVYYIKNRSGIFFKEDGKWYAEYYFDGHLMKQEFDVKW